MSRDAEGIRQLAAEYAWHVDRGDWDRAMALFVDDAVYDLTAIGGPRIQGREARLERELGIKRTARTVHLYSNHVVDVDGDRASGRCAALNYARDPDGAERLVGMAYEDEYIRTAEGWRFASRTLSYLVPPS